MIQIRFATIDDAKALLEIYAEYINTKTTFESELPTISEFQDRISSVLEMFPYLVCEEDSRILGYAYAHKFRERAAYQWSCELSIYVEQQEQSKGIGKKLYQSLIEILKFQNVQMLYSGVTIPNEKSEGLHTFFGFQPVGVYHNAGYKCSNWQSVKWFELRIGDLSASPKPLQPIYDLPKSLLDKIMNNIS